MNGKHVNVKLCNLICNLFFYWASAIEVDQDVEKWEKYSLQWHGGFGIIRTCHV